MIETIYVKHNNASIKLVKLAPWIYNRNNYYFRDHPAYHPDTVEYLDYWESHEKRSCEGMFILDQPGKKSNAKYDPSLPGGFRFYTPQHYWGMNFTLIKSDEESDGIDAFPADLRDSDFYIFYTYSICWGFSGMDKDDEFTSHYLVKKYQEHKESKFTPKEKIKWNKLKILGNITNKKGDLKKYIDPMIYLMKYHEKPVGKMLYENTKQNFMLLTSRRYGKSYIMMMILSQRYNFHHKDTYESYRKVKLGPNILVGSALSSKSGELLNKFNFSQTNLAENYGSYEDLDNNIFIPGFFHKDHMGSLNSGNEKNPYRYRYKYKRSNTWVYGGTNTSIIHGSYENNFQVFVGQATPLLIEDEVGLNDKLRAAIGADETTMVMKDKIGIMIKTGTGGDIKYSTESKLVFYDPTTYKFYHTPDYWENEHAKIGVFIPAYYTDNTFRDENGNQDLISAFEQQLIERYNRATAGDTSALDSWIIANPIKPSEMFLTADSDIFPVTLIREHIQQLEINNVFETIASVGRLVYTDKPTNTKVRWENYTDKYHKVIKTWDFRQHEGRLNSSIVIYEHPPDVSMIPDPLNKSSMYKITYDPVNDDFGGTSLCSIIVYKSESLGNWNSGVKNTIVATYHGRYDSVDDMHDIAVKLSIYFNAKILPENNLPDFIRYIKRRNLYGKLQLTPYDAVSTLISGNRSNKYEVGMRIMNSEKLQGEMLIRQHLLEERGLDKNGNKVLNLHHIYDLKLLDELVNYTRSNNTDAISAFILLMFWIYQEQQVPIALNNKKNTRSMFDNYFKKETNSNQNIHYQNVLSHLNKF